MLKLPLFANPSTSEPDNAGHPGVFRLAQAEPAFPEVRMPSGGPSGRLIAAL
jgi:hypothetical protein